MSVRRNTQTARKSTGGWRRCRLTTAVDVGEFKPAGPSPDPTSGIKRPGVPVPIPNKRPRAASESSVANDAITASSSSDSSRSADSTSQPEPPRRRQYASKSTGGRPPALRKPNLRSAAHSPAPLEPPLASGYLYFQFGARDDAPSSSSSPTSSPEASENDAIVSIPRKRVTQTARKSTGGRPPRRA